MEIQNRSRALLKLLLGCVGCASVTLAATGFKILFRWRRARRIHKMLTNMPRGNYTDKGFLGFVPDYTKNVNRKHDFLSDACRAGTVKLRGLTFEPNSFLILTKDPAFVQHILKDEFDKVSKPVPTGSSWQMFMTLWLGDGIFTVGHGPTGPDKGDVWYKQRKIAASIFSKNNFKTNMYAVFNAKALRLCDFLSDSAKNQDVVDMQKMFFQFTMDSIMEIFFGVKADTVAGEICTYAAAFDDSHRAMTDYTDKHLAALELCAILPWPLGGYRGLAQRIHGFFTPAAQAFFEAKKIIDAEGERLVRECRADPGLSSRKDLLALFVQAEEEKSFSASYLRDMTINFVLAGRDTTACTLTWMLYLLCTNPEVQTKLIEEIDRVMPSGTEPDINITAARSMPYLQGVIYEALRLHPPVPADMKMVAEEHETPDGVKLPAGVNVGYLPYAMGRDPERYPDPLQVKPERWIPFTAPSPYEFPVFQAGPRICLGQDMAIFEIKVVMTMLLQRYTFELLAGEKEKITYSYGITMSLCNSLVQDSHNLWILPKLREKK